MALLKIARMGHKVLLERAADVPDPGAPEVRRLVADMIETMLDAPGIGLAAPQVHVPWRLFVFHVPAGRSGEPAIPPQVVINPRWEAVDDEVTERVEGCLSIPGLLAAVPRAVRIRYEGVDCDGAPVGGAADGLHANVVQHEYDHLDGILYPMRVTDFSRFGFAEEVVRAQAAAAARQAQQAAPASPGQQAAPAAPGQQAAPAAPGQQAAPASVGRNAGGSR